MSSDHPEDADGPPDRRDDHDGESAKAARPGGTPAETRSHQEYYTELRIAVSAEQTTATQRTSEKEQAATEKWQEKSAESRSIWQEYQRKWPPERHRPGRQPRRSGLLARRPWPTPGQRRQRPSRVRMRQDSRPRAR